MTNKKSSVDPHAPCPCPKCVSEREAGYAKANKPCPPEPAKTPKRRILPRANLAQICKVILKWGEVVVDENGCVHTGDGATPGGVTPVKQDQCATETAKGLVRYLTDAEFAEGAPFPVGTVLSPAQICQKIDAAIAAALDDIEIPDVPDNILTADDLAKNADNEVTGIADCPIAVGDGGGNGGGGEVTAAQICAALAANINENPPGGAGDYGLVQVGLPSGVGASTGAQDGNCFVVPNPGGGG